MCRHISSFQCTNCVDTHFTLTVSILFRLSTWLHFRLEFMHILWCTLGVCYHEYYGHSIIEFDHRFRIKFHSKTLSDSWRNMTLLLYLLKIKNKWWWWTDDARGSPPGWGWCTNGLIARRLVVSHHSKFLERAPGAVTPCSSYSHPPCCQMIPWEMTDVLPCPAFICSFLHEFCPVPYQLNSP